MKSEKRGFSLVELLVVISIIGVLAGVLVASMSGGSDSARAARCLSNMKNLANACQTYGMRTSHYPAAGNFVMMSLDESRGVKNVQKRYTEVPGWISTMSQGKYPSTSYSKSPSVSMYSSDEEATRYALTNGVLWQYVSGNQNTYLCPLHAKKCPKGVKPQWSYLMSAFFGWDSSGKSTAYDKRHWYSDLSNTDKILLFSELPFSGYNTWQPEGEGSSTETDAILQYSSAGIDSGRSGAGAGGSGASEQLGVNHVKGRAAFAHVAFADGHVEKLRVPTTNGKPDTSQMAQLASWLAVGYDVSFSGSTFRRVDK